jgi:cytochrome bd-type quinol oxidase subunit 1
MASNVAIPDHYRDEFDPKSVTIPRLRSILLEMDVKATSNLKKQELIQLFESKARPKQKVIIYFKSRYAHVHV